MAQKPETRFKNRIRPILERLPRTWVAKIQQAAISGTPDFLLCVAGVFVALELKAKKGAKISPLQNYNIQRIFDCGGVSLVVFPENWDKTLELLQRLAGQTINIEREIYDD